MRELGIALVPSVTDHGELSVPSFVLSQNLLSVILCSNIFSSCNLLDLQVLAIERADYKAQLHRQ